MFFILSKILYYLVMPLVWVTAILIYGLFTKNQNRRKKALVLVLAIILLAGNEFIINEALLLWETPPVPVASLQKYDYGIVLTGVTNTQKPSVNDRVYFSKGADRLLHTVQLYKEGKIKKILVSGGPATLIGKGISESSQLKKVFLYCGIPEKDIILEEASRNTHENAVFTKTLINARHLQGKYLLITSAFHMRRAAGCFQKAGLKIDLFPVDIFTRDRRFTPEILFLPQEYALAKWAILIHEITGYIVYKLMGYC